MQGIVAAGLFALVGLCATSCQDPTRIVLHVTTDVACDRESPVPVISVGAVGAPTDDAPLTNVKVPCKLQSDQGTLIITPPASAARDTPVTIRVAMRYRSDLEPRSEECGLASSQYCIVQRRILRFEPHGTIELPIELNANCRGVYCSALETCNRASQCVSAQTGSCSPPSACDPTGLTPDGGVLPVDASSDGASKDGQGSDGQSPTDASAADGSLADGGDGGTPTDGSSTDSGSGSDGGSDSGSSDSGSSGATGLAGLCAPCVNAAQACCVRKTPTTDKVCTAGSSCYPNTGTFTHVVECTSTEGCQAAHGGDPAWRCCSDYQSSYHISCVMGQPCPAVCETDAVCKTLLGAAAQCVLTSGGVYKECQVL